MGKKKHQTGPNHNSDESTESCDEITSCPHIGKSTSLTVLKQAINEKGIQKDCEECLNSPVVNGFDLPSEFEVDDSLWMCLMCGNQGCGRAANKHALKHYNSLHPENHSLCINTTLIRVWCYDCDNQININASKKLREISDFLAEVAEKDHRKYERTKKSNFNNISPIIQTDSSTKATKAKTVTLPKVCGLRNLGNTCFFNSVLQCLGQTPYLAELLEETSISGQYFKLPGGSLVFDDNNSTILEPLDGNLESWRLLPRVLAETLRTLQSGNIQVYSPSALLSKLIQRMPQFGGGDQHDSHELLRHLLEAVREEDLRRYQAIILDKLGLSKKTDPSVVEGNKKKIIRYYGTQASEMLSPTEQVFRGILVSTLQCEDCSHTSHREEFFLDLSLPITEKTIPPLLRRKADEIEDKSKHQIKKEKRAAKKNKKYKGQKNLILPMKSVDVLTKSESNSGSESDADVEDNLEDNKHTQVNEEKLKGLESGYNSDKVDNDSPVNNRIASPDMHIDDSGVPSPAVGMLCVSPLEAGSLETSPSSSEMCGINIGSPTGGHLSPNEEMVEEFERPESRLSFVNNKNGDIKEDLEKLSLLNEGDGGKIDMFARKNLYDEACCKMEDDKEEKMEEDEDLELWTGTMSQRYQCEEGELSVQSCLNQFTACELMTSNNKVSCELCTKRYGGQEKKTVYTTATKQLLIYNPPAVLILHLKRFQVYHFRPTKVSKHVTFPTLLDLAPYCSKRSQSLPTFEVGQTQVLYSLYGVVEHSGSIHGGHYVAYIKVRPKLEKTSYRWQFLPKNQKERKPSDGLKGAQGIPDVPPGKWYYVSDSHVTEVQESKVLNAQAYLLFYER
ncbi:Peptidase, partial [Oryctes borbonicus]